MGITAVILSWKRQINVHRIVAGLRHSVSEVIVWNNNPVEPFYPVFDDGVLVVYANRNEYLLPRYAMAALAKSPCILIQDDDLKLPVDTVRGLYDSWQEQPDVVHGLYGREPKEDGTYASFFDHDDLGVEIICGRVMMFSRDLIPDFFRAWFWPELVRFRNTTKGYGQPTHADDIVLSYVALAKSRKKNQVHNFPREELPADNAVHSNENHWAIRDGMMKECRRLAGARYVI